MARKVPTPEAEGGSLRFLAEASGLPESEILKMARYITADSCIGDKKALEIRSGMPEDLFRLLEAVVLAHMDDDPKSPLYWGKEGAESSAGRRCTAAPRHMLLLYLEHRRHGLSQDYVASVYNVSQTALGRYFEYIEQALSKLLPTGDNMAERLRKARTSGRVQSAAAEALADLEKAAGAEPGSAGRPGETLPGNAALTDGVELRVQRSTDKEERDECYSGKTTRARAT